MQVIERDGEEMASFVDVWTTTIRWIGPTTYYLHPIASPASSTSDPPTLDARREDAMREGDTQARRRRRNRIVDLKHLGVCTVASKKI